VSRRWRIVLATMLLVVAMPGMLPSGVVRAAGVTFGAPEGTSTYGQSIEFTVPFTGDDEVERVELRILYPGAIGPQIVTIPVSAGSGSQTLTWTLDTTGGLLPNTPIRATWAAVTGDGEVITSRETTVLYEDTSRDWKTVRGDIVAVHWYEGDRAFGKRALEIAETAIRDTGALLGVEESEPVDFFIYGDDEAFRTALGPGTREWVAGTSISGIRTLFGLLRPDQIDDPWVEILVTHELVHLVIDTATDNPYRGPPRWIHEGLATYLSEGYTGDSRSAVEGAVRSRELLPLDAMGGQLPTDPGKAGLAYAESVSAIDHLVRTHGRDALFGLIRAYAAGVTDDEAFSQALGQDLAGFQAAWLAELGAELPEPYGPQPAPPGPLPEGWESPGGTPAPGATPAAPPIGPSTAPGTPAIPPDGGADGGRGPLVLALVVIALGGAALVLVTRRRKAPA
jgi:hypothetical protein